MNMVIPLFAILWHRTLHRVQRVHEACQSHAEVGFMNDVNNNIILLGRDMIEVYQYGGGALPRSS